MADIAKIRLGNQNDTYTEYDIKDAAARQATNDLDERVDGIEQDIILGGVYDVSAKNSGATFASLSALLSNANLSTLIPTAVRKGGMSIRFVTTSDNQYVQYRLMADEFSTTESDWQGVDDEPIAGSDNLVTSGGVAKEFQKVPVETLIGAGNDLVQSSKIYVKPLNKYRIVIKNPNISLDGISVDYGAIRFAIRPYDSNGDRIGTSDIIAVYFRNLNPLENSYEFTPPADTYSIEVLMRAKTGAEQIIWIEDTEVTYDILKDYQPLYYENKTIVDNGRINGDGTLNIAASSTFRILGLIDLSVLTFGQTLAYKGITRTETASHKKLYYRYLDTDQTTVVGVGELKNEEIATIPNGAKFLQFAISQDDLEAFKVQLAYAPADNSKEKDKSLRFAVFSDLHYGVGEDDTQRVQALYDAIVDEMISSHLDFVIFNGDMVDCSGLTKDPDTEYQYLYENLISKVKCPVFFTLGNHDGVTSVKTLEQYYLKGVQCSMETDMFYFVFLNSYYEGTRDASIPKKWDYDGVDTTFAQAELAKAAALNKIPVIVIHQLGSYSSDSVIAGLLEDFDTKIVIYSHTHTTDNANRTEGYYINPGCFLDNAKTYALCEMTTNAFTSTIVDLTNNTRTPVNVFSTIKEASASIVLYKDKN